MVQYFIRATDGVDDARTGLTNDANVGTGAWATLSFAIAKVGVVNGDTITFGNTGTITEPATTIVVSKELTINSVVGVATTFLTNTASIDPMISITANNVTITGITIRDANTTNTSKTINVADGVSSFSINNMTMEPRSIAISMAGTSNTINAVTFNYLGAAGILPTARVIQVRNSSTALTITNNILAINAVGVTTVLEFIHRPPVIGNINGVWNINLNQVTITGAATLTNFILFESYLFDAADLPLLQLIVDGNSSNPITNPIVTTNGFIVFNNITSMAFITVISIKNNLYNNSSGKGLLYMIPALVCGRGTISNVTGTTINFFNNTLSSTSVASGTLSILSGLLQYLEVRGFYPAGFASVVLSCTQVEVDRLIVTNRETARALIKDEFGIDINSMPQIPIDLDLVSSSRVDRISRIINANLALGTIDTTQTTQLTNIHDTVRLTPYTLYAAIETAILAYKT
jgi:hypothetical protein